MEFKTQSQNSNACNQLVKRLQMPWMLLAKDYVEIAGSGKRRVFQALCSVASRAREREDALT